MRRTSSFLQYDLLASHSAQHPRARVMLQRLHEEHRYRHSKPLGPRRSLSASRLRAVSSNEKKSLVVLPPSSEETTTAPSADTRKGLQTEIPAERAPSVTGLEEGLFASSRKKAPRRWRSQSLTSLATERPQSGEAFLARRKSAALTQTGGPAPRHSLDGEKEEKAVEEALTDEALKEEASTDEALQEEALKASETASGRTGKSRGSQWLGTRPGAWRLASVIEGPPRLTRANSLFLARRREASLVSLVGDKSVVGDGRDRRPRSGRLTASRERDLLEASVNAGSSRRGVLCQAPQPSPAVRERRQKQP